MALSDETRELARELIARYPKPRSALLPMLHLVQSEEGYVSPAGIGLCAELLGLTKAEVGAVATFYTMYKRKPTGEHLVSVCTNTLCGMLGGDEIFAALSEQLGIGNNETSADGKITIERAECLAACDYAPVVTVNYEFFDNQSVGSARSLVSELQNGALPQPTRGGSLCSFKQIERQIAGFFDEQTLAPEAVSAGVPTEIGVKLAIDRRESAPSYAIERGGESSLSPAERLSVEGSEAADHATAPVAPEPPAAPEQAELFSTQPTSSHDAPLKTAESDPDHDAGEAK